MNPRLFLALACVLVAVRVPSLAQPMGADQALYAYVGERILEGGLPYRDAWDQKPPAVHLAYAAMRALWPADAVVPAADLLLSTITAALVYLLGTATHSVRAGQASALILLFLSNPAFQRLAGVSVRAQCEVFIAALVAGALLLLARDRHRHPAACAAAGALLGAAFTFKYNAGVYAPMAAAALLLWGRFRVRDVLLMAAGFLVPPTLLLGVFAWGGALSDLWGATITYNVMYSGETYTGPGHFVAYLLTFPIQHARVDGLWLVGGAGCAILLAASWRAPERLLPPLWVAAACLSIAINGSRGLPQYFVQAAPALALAAGTALAVLWSRRRAVNAAALAVVAIALWRVNEFPKLADNTWHDARALAGAMPRDAHLARYGDRGTRKYSALAVAELADYAAARTRPEDSIYVFGFSSGVYVRADRASASRFFWSRPVIVGFLDERRGYGVDGLLEDLTLNRPAMVALQVRDWAPDVEDSAAFFMATPPLAAWLEAHYARGADAPPGFDVWMRRGARP